MLGGPEQTIKDVVSLGLAGACLLGSAGVGAVACATIVPILVGTAFNAYDAYQAGGFMGPDPNTNWHNFVSFMVNEGITVGTGTLLNNHEWVDQAASQYIGSPYNNFAADLTNILQGPMDRDP